MPSSPIPLTDLTPGARARLHLAHDAEHGALLAALGLSRRVRFVVCKTGDPWILQVRGTRIGLADQVAATLLVVPEVPVAELLAPELVATPA